MKLRELFTLSFITGLLLGLLLIWFIATECVATGFKGEYLFYYLVILALTLITSGENEPKTFMFFVGLGIPYTIIVLGIFLFVDMKHKKQGKGYREWEW